MMKMRLSCFCIMTGAEAFTAVPPAEGEVREVSPYAQMAKNAVGSELTYKQKISLGMEDIFENKLTQYTNKLAQAAKIRAELSTMLNMALEADDDVMRNLVNAERFRDGDRGSNDDEIMVSMGNHGPIISSNNFEAKTTAANGAKKILAKGEPIKAKN